MLTGLGPALVTQWRTEPVRGDRDIAKYWFRAPEWETFPN